MNDIYTIEWIADDGVYKILYLDRQLECLSEQYIGTHPWFDIVAVLQWRRIRIINTRLTNLKPWDQLSIRPLTRYEKTEHEIALRYNEWKPRWSLVHFPSLEPLVRVLEFWAKKYEEKNWMKPMDKKQILDSMIRHLVRLMEDEELDSESNLPHIGHIMANCMFYSYHSK